MTERKTRILVVDDDASTRKAMSIGLSQDGYDVVTADSAEAALPLLLQDSFDALVTDVVMGGMSGIALLRRVRELRQGLPVIVITGFGSIDSAVEAMREGAADYLPKPIRFEQLGEVLRRALRAHRDDAEADTGAGKAAVEILGQSEAIRRVLGVVASVATTDATVLVRGESGTGKELVARAIHRASPRARRKLVTLNCSAITETLAESELFGHEKGAFTGAARRRKGRIELADGGTLFLDEIGDLAPALQTKLLRVLQDHAFERVGGAETLTSDVRILAATNRELEHMIEVGHFRQDLYYRLDVVTITVPPLRDRVEDIPLLARHFLEELTLQHTSQHEPPIVGRGVLDALRAHPWPGNVRELRNVIEHLVVTVGKDRGRIRLGDLPPHIRGATPASASAGDAPLLDGSRSLEEIELAAIQRTLTRTGGNKAEAARILGIGLKTLYRKLKT